MQTHHRDNELRRFHSRGPERDVERRHELDAGRCLPSCRSPGFAGSSRRARLSRSYRNGSRSAGHPGRRLRVPWPIGFQFISTKVNGVLFPKGARGCTRASSPSRRRDATSAAAGSPSSAASSKATPSSARRAGFFVEEHVGACAAIAELHGSPYRTAAGAAWRGAEADASARRWTGPQDLRLRGYHARR